MLNNIQVPEPINHMPEANQNIRHIRKWILFIGIPLLIVAIIVGVYFYSLRPRRSASQTVDQSSKSPEPRLQNPGSNSAILPDQSL